MKLLPKLLEQMGSVKSPLLQFLGLQTAACRSRIVVYYICAIAVIAVIAVIAIAVIDSHSTFIEYRTTLRQQNPTKSNGVRILLTAYSKMHPMTWRPSQLRLPILIDGSSGSVAA